MVNDRVVSKGDGNEVEAFLAKVRGGESSIGVGGRGRLVFALDATASRQPTWDTACQLQDGMFREVTKIGGLDVQLVYYRGTNECRASRWVPQSQQLRSLMEKIDCRAGETQIGRILNHVRRETRISKVHAVVFVGDAMEEIAEDLYDAAAGLDVPVFLFQEGEDRKVKRVFREIARLTGGAYCSFDAGAANQLGQLLRAVATFAVGGVRALADLRGNTSAAQLLAQMKS